MQSVETCPHIIAKVAFGKRDLAATGISEAATASSSSVSVLVKPMPVLDLDCTTWKKVVGIASHDHMSVVHSLCGNYNFGNELNYWLTSPPQEGSELQ